MGVTRDEGAIVQLLLDPLLSFYYPMRSVWSAVHYRATLLSIFKTEVRTRKILEKYPISEKSWRVNYESFTQILTDYAFYCPSLSVARKLALTNEVYFYEFNYVPDYMSFSKPIISLFIYFIGWLGFRWF